MANYIIEGEIVEAQNERKAWEIYGRDNGQNYTSIEEDVWDDD